MDTRALHARVGKEGTVVFPFVPEGRYKLSDRRARIMFIDVPADGVPVFVAQFFDALRVVLADTRSNYWRDVGVATGDVIVAIDGKRFSPTKKPGDLVPSRHAPIAEKVRLTLRSASGAERNVEVLYYRFFGAKGAGGGHLEPLPVGSW